MPLREIHHRVKNNLQIISSLLNLQAGFSSDRKTNTILEDSKNRVKSMALIHERLYQTKNFTSLDIQEFIEELTKNLFHSYGTEKLAIEKELRIAKINLSADQAIYIGLIVNELVSNSLKHAFKDDYFGIKLSEVPKITIVIQDDVSGRYSLTVADNGQGFPVELNFRETESLGLQLVMSLVKQIDGEINMSTEEGTEFRIIFTKPN